MNEYSRTLIVVVVLVAFIAGYSIVSFVFRRVRADAARGREADDAQTPATQERVNVSATDDDPDQERNIHQGRWGDS